MANPDFESIMADYLNDRNKASPSKPKKKESVPEKLFEEDNNSQVYDLTTHKLYSELFGWDDSLQGKEDYPVRVYNDTEWDVNGLANIPKNDSEREIDHRVFYPFVRGVQAGLKMLLVGDAGTGKSTMAEVYCARINQPFLRINGRRDMESDSILGRPWVNNGHMEYLLGEWPKASAAGWFVLVDEPWKMPSGIWMAAQRHMERGGIWQIDEMPGNSVQDKQIKPADSYRVILADNVVGTGDNNDKYGATLIQDGSLLNRLDMVLRCDYLPQDKEAALITKKYKFVPENKAKQMVKLFSMLRSGFSTGELSVAASPRNLFAWAELAYMWKDYEYAFKLVMLNRYADMNERQAVANNYSTVFGKNLEV